MLALSPRWLKVLHDLRDNLPRTLLSVASIAVGVTAFGGMLAARNAVVANIEHAYRGGNPSDMTIDMAPFDAELLRWVKQQPGVQEATGVAIVSGVMLRKDGSEKDITIYGYDDYADIPLNTPRPVSGKFPPDRGEFLFERAGVSAAAMTPGEAATIRLATDATFSLRYVGSLYDVSVPAGPAASRWAVYVAARTLADLGVDARPTRLAIRVAPGMSVQEKYALADRLIDSLTRHGMRIRGFDVNERGEHWAASTASGVIFILVLVGAAALLLSGFLIVNVVNGLLLSQRRIIAVMKIVGGDRWQIMGVYMAMMAILGVLAAMIALPTSAALGRTLAGFIAGVINFDIVIAGFTWQIAAAEIGVALFVPMAFAAWPIWSALRVPAAEAISDVMQRSQAGTIERMLARLDSLPRILVLAFRSLFRNRVRMLMTMATLIAAGGIFIAVLNLRVAMPRTIVNVMGVNSADVTLSLRSSIPAVAAENRARQVAGVEYAEGWITAQATIVRADGDGSTLQINGGASDSPLVAPIMQSGRWLSKYGEHTRNEIVLAESVLDEEPNLALGDTVTLRSGNDEYLFRIVGFVRRIGGGMAPPLAYTHFDTASRLVGTGGRVTSVRVRAADTSASYTENLLFELRRSYEDAGIAVANAQSRTTLISNVQSSFEVIITVMLVVAVLISVVGGLGLAGTMSLSVMERTREIGVMRAIGAETGDLHTMFIIEGLFIGLLSALASFVLSVPLTDIIGSALGAAVRIGEIERAFSANGYVAWPAIVCVVSIVASSSPARRAGQISIREALAYA
jgi:putative ABC transport system permease protein